jgi:hypothetical protein
MFFLVMYKGEFLSCSLPFPFIIVAERQGGYNMCKGFDDFGVLGDNGFYNYNQTV